MMSTTQLVCEPIDETERKSPPDNTCAELPTRGKKRVFVCRYCNRSHCRYFRPRHALRRGAEALRVLEKNGMRTMNANTSEICLRCHSTCANLLSKVRQVSRRSDASHTLERVSPGKHSRDGSWFCAQRRYLSQALKDFPNALNAAKGCKIQPRWRFEEPRSVHHESMTYIVRFNSWMSLPVSKTLPTNIAIFALAWHYVAIVLLRLRLCLPQGNSSSGVQECWSVQNCTMLCALASLWYLMLLPLSGNT